MCFHQTLYYLIYDWHILGKNSNALNDSIPVRTSFTTKGQLISECLFNFLNFPKTTEKFDKFLPKNMEGVEIIKIKTMPYTTTIYI